MFKANFQEKNQTIDFIKKTQGCISIRIFPLGAHDGEDFEGLIEIFEKQIKLINEFFVYREQNLQLILLILFDKEILVLRDKSKGNSDIDTYFDEVTE